MQPLAPLIVSDTDIQPVFNTSPPRKVPLYKSADWNVINEEAELFKENYLLSCKPSSVETNWKTIKIFVHNIMENYIPHKTLTRKNHLSWFDRQAKSLVRKKINCIIVPRSLVSLRIGIPIAKSDPQLINTWLRGKKHTSVTFSRPL